MTDAEPPWIPKLADRVAGALGEERGSGEVALVVHSGAGSLVPAITLALSPRVRAAVFVDALLPHPGRSWFDRAPAALAARLRELNEGGLLPPWDQWFPRGAIDSHLADEALRKRFVDELPRLPFAYFEEVAPRAEGWESIPCGYVQLSDAYGETAREAAARGWPTLHEPSDHLAMLTRPEAIAEALDRMLEKLGIPRQPAR